MPKRPRLQAVRIPYHRGLFYFGPHFLRSEDEWQSDFSKLIELLLHDAKHPWMIADHSGWTITIRFELTDFVIDAKNGTFTIWEHNDKSVDGWDEWFGPINEPEAFFEDLLNSDHPDKLETEVNYVSAFAGDLMRQLLARRRKALRNGHAVIEARVGLISNDFRSLEQDQVRRLKIIPFERDFEVGREDARFDDAKSPNGEMFYSFCIVPTLKTEQPELQENGNKTAKADERVRFPEDIYNPVIEQCAQEVKRQFGKRATQAEVKRRATAKFVSLGWDLPGKTIFERRVKNIFDKK